MRSLDYLLQLYPDKTAKEILEIQAKEKEEAVIEQKKRDKDKIDFINDINTNGAFYKGRFGLDQRFYYSLTNAQLIDGIVYGDVESLTVFLGVERSVIERDGVKIELKKSTFKDLGLYGLNTYRRTTKEDFEKAKAYIRRVSKFWENIG